MINLNNFYNELNTKTPVSNLCFTNYSDLEICELLKLDEHNYSDDIKNKIICFFRENPTLLDLSNKATFVKVGVIADSIIMSQKEGIETEKGTVTIDFYEKKVVINLQERKVENMPDTDVSSVNSQDQAKKLFLKILSLFPKNHYLATYFGFGSTKYSSLENGEYACERNSSRMDFPEYYDEIDKRVANFIQGKTKISTSEMRP